MTLHLPLAAATLAAGLLTASPALAASPGSDDVQRPDARASFTNAARFDAIETPDVTYPGPHAAVVKSLAPAPAGAIAASDDVLYPSADAPARVARAAPRRAPELAAAGAPARATDARLACGCPRG